ncbi:MAG TPA: hypothetical protein DEG69_08510, partial [Flavobacteriaceae bacterium]|nr:hypothetical protein [Flavobacteriaceae bacterium]
MSSFQLQAQDAVLKGRIVDTNSSEPLPDVEVRIQSSNFNTVTTSEGIFNITGSDLPQGEQVLLVNKVGYHGQRIQIIIQNGET